jgi:hypothetical protein
MLRYCRPVLEQLEDRRLLAVTRTFSAGVLTFTGDGADDKVILQSTPTPTTVEFDDGSGLGSQTQSGVTQVIFHGNGGADELVLIQQNPNIFAPAGGIQFNGGSGSDTLHMAGGTPATFTSGNYNITGPASGTISYTTTGGTVNVALTGMELINDTTESGTHTTTGTAAGENITVEPGPTLPPVAGFVQGPVIVDGGDRDDHGFFSGGENQNGWLFIEQMVDFVHGHTFNGAPNDILAIGAKANEAMAAIDSAASELGLSVTHVNFAVNIATVDFNQYKMIYLPSGNEHMPGGGGILGSEIDALFARRTDIQAYVRSGGGIVCLTEEDTSASSGPYGWLRIPDPFVITGFNVGGISDPLRKTPEAITAGFTISDAELSLGVPYHNVFIGPAGFNGLDVFVKDDGPNNIVGDSDDRNGTLGQGAINQSIGGGVTTRIFGSFPTLQVGQKPALVVNAAGGNDAILVKGDVLSLDGLPAPLTINGGTGVNTLSMIDTADLVGDSVVATHLAVSGLASFPINYSSIQTLNLTATQGDDDLNLDFTTGSLTTANVFGHNGRDDFFGPGPSNRVQPSLVTTINLDGGDPSPAYPQNGNLAGMDTMDLDVSALNGPVIVNTLGLNASLPGVVQSIAPPPLVRHKLLTFIRIEDVDMHDKNLPTQLQMGDLYVRGSNGNVVDSVQFTGLGLNLTRLRVNSYQNSFAVTRRCIVYGRGGNDYLVMGNFKKPGEIYGEDGDDYISGYLADDILVGGQGRDRINGSQGDNEIWGDRSPLEVGLPDDEANRALFSAALPGSMFHPNAEATYADTLSGLNGMDEIYCGPGPDLVTSGSGEDYVFGGQGNDNIASGDGNDRIFGGLGDDILTGDEGDDLLSGNEGQDLIFGKTGSDVLIGGAGDDSLNGDDGNDALIDGAAGYNSAAGNDASQVAGDASDLAMALLLLDWSADNVLNGALINSHEGDDQLSGNDGDDSFFDDLLAEILDFGFGNDVQII